MSNQANFVVSYDGTALEQHAIDVKDLAPALLACGALFEATNRIINGDGTEIKLKVVAHQAGSFEINFELAQNLLTQIKELFNHNLYTATHLIDLIVSNEDVHDISKGVVASGIFGGLLWLIRKLRGRKPDKIKKLPNGMFEISIGGQTFIIPLELLNLYQDVAVRKAVAEITHPLREKDGIDRLLIKNHNNQVIQEINATEATYFAMPDIEQEQIAESETIEAFSIVSLAFNEKNKWRLFDGNNVVNVTISDTNFLNNIDKNLISFAKGDVLKCRLKKVQWREEHKLKADYEVLEVIEHKPAMQQLKLF